MKTNYTVYGLGGYDVSKPGNNITEQYTAFQAGLNSDRTTVPADGTTAAVCHYAGSEASAVWNVNGSEVTEATVQDAASGLRVSELEVVLSSPGTITVSCNGFTLTLEAK
jgi:phage baseplate assembly protein gpV